MRRRPSLAVLAVYFVLATLTDLSAADPVAKRTWKIGDTEREALLYIPETAKSTAAPVVFAFHGHGGTMHFAATKFAIHKHWPQAIAVYPQGLKTPGQITDPEGTRSGWQRRQGDQDDRDLKLFDAILESLGKDYKVDQQNIFSTGHSNGGGFTYLLWEQRPDVLRAVAPCAAAAGYANKLKPKPAFHMAGEKDPLVKFEWQQRTIDALKRLDGCGEGEVWNKEKLCQIYPSKSGTPVVTYIHPGGHELPGEVPPLVVKFFQEQLKK